MPLTTKEAIEAQAKYEYMNDVTLALKVWEDMHAEAQTRINAVVKAAEVFENLSKELQAEVDRLKEDSHEWFKLYHEWFKLYNEEKKESKSLALQLATCREDTLREAIIAVMNERLEGTTDYESDKSYNNAVEDCKTAIQSLIDNPTKG